MTIRRRQVDRPVATGRRAVMRWMLTLFLLGIASCADSPNTEEMLAELGGRPCPDSDFTCVTIDAPIDHNDPDGEKIPVTFAVSPAAKRTEGVFVTAVGGPGASGVEEATWRYPDLDADIRDYYDVVFFDQRGLGMSEELTCTETEESFATSEDDTESEPVWDQLAVQAEEYVKACTDEIGRPELLANLGTAQAAADLELFRQTMGYRAIGALRGELWDPIRPSIRDQSPRIGRTIDPRWHRRSHQRHSGSNHDRHRSN